MSVDRTALLSAVCAAGVAFFAVSVLKPLQPTLQHPPPRRYTGLIPWVLQYVYEFTYDNVYDHDVQMVRCSDKATTYRLLGIHVIGVYHPLDLEHILVKNYMNYKKGFSYELAKKVLGEALVTLPHGERHAQHRRIVSPAFSPSALKRISQLAMEGHVTELLHVLKDQVKSKSAASLSSEAEIIVQDLISRTALNIIAEAAFRLEKSDLEELAEHVKLVRDRGINVVEFLPIVNKLPTPAAVIGARFMSLTAKIVSKAAKGLQENPELVAEGSGRAIIDYLVQSKQLNTSELCDHSVTLLFAGFDTSSNSVLWALAHLAQHQSVQQKLFEELAAVMGPGIYPDVDVVRRCTYLTNVIKETMRVTPVVNDLPRTAANDDVLPYSKVVVPAGTEVDVSIIGAHRNPRIFGTDANDFRPERWEDPTLEQRVGSCGFIPFSAGPRNCIGKDFAWNEMYALLSLIVRNFSFRFGEGQSFPKEIITIVVFPEAYRMLMRERH